jgi:chromosome segregation ATPase
MSEHGTFEETKTVKILDMQVDALRADMRRSEAENDELRAQIERLRERLEVAKRDRNKIQDDRVRLETQLAYYVTNGGGNQGLIDNLREENCRILKLDVGLHTEIERLRKALEWYAADTNYIGYEDSDVMVDRGRRAIAALEVSDDNPAGG